MSTYISLRGNHFLLSELDQIEIHNEFEEEAIGFIDDWLSGRESFEQYTSGSSGTPKLITLSRSQMMASALGTIKALRLKPNNNSLLCMNPRYIGGKMMIVRSLINKMNLILTEPSSSPISKVKDQIDFTALTPHQMSVMMNSDKSKELLNKIDTIILGGAAVSLELEKQIESLKSHVFSTYGMTETSSHIALKRLNGQNKSNYFTALDEVELGINNQECLTINGAVTNFQTIVTNDRVHLIGDKQFEWLGRVDNVINSGGIKVQSEKLEKAIEQIFIDLGLSNRLFISSLTDDVLGQKVTLFVEGKLSAKELKLLEQAMKQKFEKYHKPKDIFVIPQFDETDSGKVDRKKTKQSVSSKSKNKP